MATKFKAREYQNHIIDFIQANNRCAIWASMGAGKTVSTLTAVDQLQLMGEDTPTLVLAPLLVAKETWPDEVTKWEHLKHMRVMPIIGNEQEKMRALRHKANVYTTNYESLPWLEEYLGKRWPFKRVIADESTKLKGFRLKQGTKRAKALGKVAHKDIKFFNQLTGTPSPNGLIDLWGQMWFLDAGRRLGRTFTDFKERFFRPSFDGYGSEPTEAADKVIHDLLRDVCLTVDVKDYMDIKEPIVVNKYFELPTKARELYKEMEDKFYFELENRSVEALNGASKSQKLLQIANGACYLDPLTESDDDPPNRSKDWKEIHDGKLQILESIVNEAAGMPVLVAYHFNSDRERLAKAFKGSRVMTQANSSEVMKDWNAGKIPVLFAHPQSAGHGLSLQMGGNIMVYFGHYWNLEQRMQILERIGPTRQAQSGFDRPVFVYNIIARNTIDELVIARTETKASIQDLLLQAMKLRKGK